MTPNELVFMAQHLMAIKDLAGTKQCLVNSGKANVELFPIDVSNTTARFINRDSLKDRGNGLRH